MATVMNFKFCNLRKILHFVIAWSVFKAEFRGVSRCKDVKRDFPFHYIQGSRAQPIARNYEWAHEHKIDNYTHKSDSKRLETFWCLLKCHIRPSCKPIFIFFQC